MSISSRIITSVFSTLTALGSPTNAAETSSQPTTQAASVTPIKKDPPAYVIQFTDEALAERNRFYKSVPHEIRFDANAFTPAVRTKYDATFALMAETGGFGRTDWVTKTDTGWVSNGGADPYEQWKDFQQNAPVRYIHGQEVRGPYRLSLDAQTDLTDSSKRFEARFGPHVLAFKSQENAKAFQKLVLNGEFLPLQNFQCAQAPVAVKNSTGLQNQHLATSANPIWASLAYTGNPGDGGVEYPGKANITHVMSVNAGHVGMNYENWLCADQSNKAFWQLRTAANASSDAAAKFAAVGLVYDMQGPAASKPAAEKNLDCGPLNENQLRTLGFSLD